MDGVSSEQLNPKEKLQKPDNKTVSGTHRGILKGLFERVGGAGIRKFDLHEETKAAPTPKTVREILSGMESRYGAPLDEKERDQRLRDARNLAYEAYRETVRGRWFTTDVKIASEYKQILFVDVPQRTFERSVPSFDPAIEWIPPEHERVLPASLVSRAVPLTNNISPPPPGFVRMYRGQWDVFLSPAQPAATKVTQTSKAIHRPWLPITKHSAGKRL
jgi:hypothetical protein